MEESEIQPHQAVFHVQTHAHAGGEVADQRLHDAEHAERILGERVLRQYQQAADLIVPHDGEVNHERPPRFYTDAKPLEAEDELCLFGDRAQTVAGTRHHRGQVTAHPCSRNRSRNKNSATPTTAFKIAVTAVCWNAKAPAWPSMARSITHYA